MSYVIVQKVWRKVSENGDSVEVTRTFVAAPETTLDEITDWAEIGSYSVRGDLVITEAEYAYALALDENEP